MIVFPCCKINLGLRILSKRADGYHNISTVMYPIEWCDAIEIVPSTVNADRLFTSGRAVDCPPEKNLVMKALRAIAAGRDLPALDVYLRKNVPDGAGLGGGSADAAFMLKAVNKYCDLRLTDDCLEKIAAAIGADCAFFIRNRPALATGIGAELTGVDVDLSAYTIVIAKPATTAVSTAEAYAGVTPTPDAECPEDVVKLPVECWQGRLINDFEPSVMSRCPAIARVKALMLDNGAVYASMSGSGAAVYGIFNDAKLADKIVPLLADCDVFVRKQSVM